MAKGIRAAAIREVGAVHNRLYAAVRPYAPAGAALHLVTASVLVVGGLILCHGM